jgi:endo-1,4-beta-xylanase
MNAIYKHIILPSAIFFLAVNLHAQELKEVLLWPNGAPGSEGKNAPDIVKIVANNERIVSGVHHPSLTPFLPAPAKASGAAIIIAPGGGHYQLSMDSEGFNVGRWLSEHGIAAFVLKYRLAREPNSTYTIDGDEMADMQRSIRLVRSRAKEWGIDTARIGVLGFSAGGELAGLAAMRYDSARLNDADAIDHESSKPAFQALIYPGGSRRFEVSKKSLPLFIVCGYNDRPDISRGMAELYLKYKADSIPAELHIYASSGHGFGYRENDTKAEAGWLARLQDWMKDLGFMKSR